MLSRDEIAGFLETWIAAWNRHDLPAALEELADDVLFQHWNSRITRGKRNLRRLWTPWFADHGGFHFAVKSLLIDHEKQAASFEWELDWPSPEPAYRGRREVREGIDYIQFREGKVAVKRSYIRTRLVVDGRSFTLKG